MWLDCGLGIEAGDHFDGFVWVVGPLYQIHVDGVDGAAFDEGVVDEGLEVGPELFTHDDDGEAFNFFGLDEDECFEDFVEGPESSRQNDECGGVFDEHDFADEEVVEIDETVEVGVGVLLHGEFDVAS